MTLSFRKGDATLFFERPAIIAHVVNNQGAWGAGFVLAVSKLSPRPEACYRAFYPEYELGQVQYVSVSQGLIVANMFAQTLGGPRPLRDDALVLCLRRVFKTAAQDKASVHMPRIGCGLAGGTWSEIEPLVDLAREDFSDVPVYVYDL